MKSFFPLLLLIVSHTFANKKVLTLNEAVKQQKISSKVLKVTGFKGKCLTLQLSNNSDDSLYILVPAGWVFDSDDSTKQNLLVVKDAEFAMAKRETKAAAIAVNCCQLHNHSPAGSKFSKGFEPKKQLVELAKYLSREDFKEQTICSAVWAVSDKTPISQICGSGVDNDEKLRKKVAEIRGEKIPWYKVKTIQTEQNDGSIKISPTELYGEFECNIPLGTEYEVKLTDPKGNEVMVLMPLRKMKESNGNFSVNFAVGQLPEKKFNITFYDPYGVVLLEKEFDLRM